MALFGLDAGGNSAYVQAAGDGTLANPYILQHDLLPTDIQSRWATVSGDSVVVSGVTSAKLRVLNVVVTTESGGTVQLRSGASGVTLTPAFPIVPSGYLVFGNTLGVVETAPGQGLYAIASSGIECQVLITYREVGV
jgi:hypothetical protein